MAGSFSTKSGQRKSFQDAMGPVYDKYVTTPKMKELVKRIQEIK